MIAEAFGRFLDRMCFWNIPAVIKSYEMPVPCETFMHQGLEVWHIPGRSDGPTVLFCHGNAGHLRFPNVRRDRFLALHEAGANLWAFDYRGYGLSVGRPSEHGLYADARVVHELARERHPAGRRFVLYGRSLGGAIAMQLATEVQTPDSLILESTFTSVKDVVSEWLVPVAARTMTYRFDSLERVRRLACPLYMIQGTHDKIVPYHLGRKLWDACSTGEEFLSVWQAGHNNLQQASEGLYQETLFKWLSGFRELEVESSSLAK